jgi:hypothetical protein
MGRNLHVTIDEIFAIQTMLDLDLVSKRFGNMSAVDRLSLALRRPSASAVSIIALATLSFMLPAGFVNSRLANILADSFGTILRS